MYAKGRDYWNERMARAVSKGNFKTWRSYLNLVFTDESSPTNLKNERLKNEPIKKLRDKVKKRRLGRLVRV